MSIFEKIGSFFSGGFLREATNLIDQLVTSKEEKEVLKQSFLKLTQEHESRLKELGNEDRNSARDLQKSALAQEDIFSKRFVYYLASIWSVAGISYVFGVTFFEIGNARTADTVLGFLMGTIVSTIINYFFGAAMPNASTPKSVLKGWQEEEKKPDLRNKRNRRKV